MSISKVLGVVATVLLAASTAGAATRCNLNPGGPSELVLTVPEAGSDIDVGWTGEVHDYDVPSGAQFALCLLDCDNDTDPECTVNGQADQLTAAGRSFAPPIPVVIGNNAVCIQLDFAATPVTGTFNVQTGALDASASLVGNVFVTSKAAVCPQCVAGTCSGGPDAGNACSIDETVNVQGATGDTTYDVSLDCSAGGLGPIPVPLTVDVTTGLDSQGTCPGQEQADDCGAGDCNAVCVGGGHGGIRQTCCSNDTSKSCFANPFTRTGNSAPPQPVWPDPSYPKTRAATSGSILVSAFCAPAAPLPFGGDVNDDAGLAGPVAFFLPVAQELIGDSDGDGLPDSLDGCTFDADCDDDGVNDGSIDGGEDTNDDGVLDTGETDPTDQDSDNDGLPDGLERGLTEPQRPTDFGGTFVADADPATTTNGANPDTDGDGLLDGAEDANHNGRVDAGETDPNVADGPVGGCSSATECNDNDPCTDDSCPADACVFTQKSGAEGAQCELDDVQDGPICGTDPLDAKTTKAVSTGLAKVDALLAKIATASTPKKKAKLIKKAKAALKVVQTKAGKAGKKGKISTDCAATITATMAELSAIVGAL